MKKHLQYFLLFLLLGIFPQKSSAQFFVVDQSPCKSGPEVKLDPVTFKPDIAMPFDRCFSLRFVVKGIPDIKYFAINPIDRNGKLNITRRDYRVFLKSGWSNTDERKKAKRKLRYEQFKRSKVNRLFSKIDTIRNGNKTEVILGMPPLDPNREYQIILISEDLKSAKEVVALGELIFKTSDFTTNKSIQTEIKHKLSRLASSRNDKLGGVEYNSFIHYLSDDILSVNKELETTDKVRDYINQHKAGSFELTQWGHLFFVPSGRYMVQPQSADISKQDHISFKFSGNATLVPLQDRFEEIQEIGETKIKHIKIFGTEMIVNFMSTTKYDIYFIATDTIKVKRKYVTSSVSNVRKLGEYDIRNDGRERIFTPNPNLPDKEFVKLIPNVLEYHKNLNQFSTVIDSITSPGTPDKSGFEILLKESIAVQKLDIQGKKQTISEELDQTIIFFANSNATTNLMLAKGLISIKEITNPINKSELKKRLFNLNITRTKLNQIVDFSSRIVLIYPTDSILSTNHKWLLSLNTLIILKIKEIEKFLELEAGLTRNYCNEFTLYSPDVKTLASSTPLDLVSAANFRITPDFGFLAVFKGDNSLHVQDLTPYMGFHINFRSIDKNVSMSHIRFKHWTHYVSFTSGITLRTLKIENKRDDFFGSFCFITGFGYRFNNYFRLTIGTVWFKSKDTNPLTTNRPIKFSPFLGLSLDLDLRKYFNGLSTLF